AIPIRPAYGRHCIQKTVEAERSHDLAHYGLQRLTRFRGFDKLSQRRVEKIAVDGFWLPGHYGG
ncbi:MAG: hypothetical protein ABI920_17445, partial [Casimicrobiaceae bacterium]